MKKIPPSTKDKKTRLECRAVDDFAPNLPTRYPDMASSAVVINSNICSNPFSHGLSKTNKRHQNPPGPLMRLPRQRPNPSLPWPYPPEQTPIPQPRWQAPARWQCRRCSSPGWLGGWRLPWLWRPPRANTATKARTDARSEMAAQPATHSLQPRCSHQIEQIALAVPTAPAFEPPAQHCHHDQERHPDEEQSRDQLHDRIPPRRRHIGQCCAKYGVQTDQHTDERNDQHRLPAGKKQIRESHFSE